METNEREVGTGLIKEEDIKRMWFHGLEREIKKQKRKRKGRN